MAQYTESIITYFDILGFKALVARAADPEEVARKLRALKRHSTTEEDIAELYGSTFTNFSDLVLRTVPVQQNPQTSGPGTLFWELLDLVHVQAELIKSKVLLRGALTIGDIYVRDGITFGPGLIRAYELESTVALYPRVIVDPAIFAASESRASLRNHPFQQEFHYWKQLITRGSDGVWFVDYLRAFQAEVDHQEGYLTFLKDHRDLIVEALSGMLQLDAILVKLGWLMNYHNRAVRNLSDSWLQSVGEDRDELLVEPDTSVFPTLVPD